MARIPYPTAADLQPVTLEELAKIRDINVFRMMAWAEGLAPPMFAFVKELFASLTLDARLRQLAIVCVGHLCASPCDNLRCSGCLVPSFFMCCLTWAFTPSSRSTWIRWVTARP